LRMIRPKLFLDTNICIDVASGKICLAEWRLVRKYINAHYRYYVSWVTLKELLTKLGRGSDDCFQRNKEPLRVLYGPAKRRFLPYPSVFAIRSVLGVSIARNYKSNLAEENVLEAVLRAAIVAPNKAALRSGIRARGQRRFTRIDLDDFDAHENAPQNEHAELLQGIREGTIDKPERRKWSAWILHQCGLTPYFDDCEQLGGALDAAYCFSLSLSKFANDRGYDFKKRASDWGDTFQLFYLCDDSMHFLTKDADFRNRTRDSPQSCRILTYKEFVGLTVNR